MEKCRGQYASEKRANKEMQKLLAENIAVSCEDNGDMYDLPQNSNKSSTVEQMKRDGHINF